MSSKRLPSFIIAGATRSGTTTLYEALRHNPHIFMPEQKELHYFYRDGDFEQRLDFYSQYFEKAQPEQICGEASPTYLHKGYSLDHDLKHKFVPENDSAVRIKNQLPDVKIILSLRHPATRAHSFFWRTVWHGHDKARSFEQAIEEELAGQRTPEHTPLCPLYINRYAIHLKHWIKNFSQDQILVLVMEEWTKEPAKAVAQIEEFIGAKTSGLKDEEIQPSNEGRRVIHPLLKPLTKIAPGSKFSRMINRHLLSKQGYEKLSPETFEKLGQVFKDDVKFVEEFLGRPVPSWKEKSL